ARGAEEWVYVYAGHTFGWLPARALTLQINSESVPFNSLPETEAQGFAIREFGRFVDVLAALGGTTITPVARDISVNTPTQSVLTAGEVQSWQFRAQPDRAYVITMNQTNMTLDPYLRVKDAGGNVIVEDDDSGGNLNALARLEVRQSGEFIIEASSLNPTDAGEFVLEVRDAGPLLPSNEWVVTVGQPMEATLELGDVHRWQFTVRGGDTYTITMERTSNEVDPYLILTDAGGSLLAEDDDSAGNLNAQIVYTFTTPGEYFIEARSYTLTTSGGYLLRVDAEGQAANPTPTVAESVSTPNAGERILEVGVPQQVFLDVTEVHVWQFEAQAGQSYVITMNNASGTVDPRLTLKNAQGSILAENDDSAGSFNSLITFTPEVSGTYFVEAATFSPTESGDYIIQ
ncbi:MAG: PPC domain-containing protein, partial [Anaerolineae bacterium]|nr:PPC domain-containing protein [Anaerolineae bacterium]